MPNHQFSAEQLTTADSAVRSENLESRRVGLSQSDRWFLIAVSIFVTCLAMSWIWQYQQANVETITLAHAESHDFTFSFDINHGTWVEWMQLEGVGETTARNIVSHREEFGPFRSVDDVQRVPGIGKVTMEKMRPHLRCDECD